MDVGVYPSGGQDFSFAGDDLRARANNDIDAGLDVRIAGLADLGDAAVGERHVGLDDPPMVDDQRVGNDGVDRALSLGVLRLTHAVADHFAAAELYFLAIGGEVVLHFDDQVGVGQANAVPGGRTEHVRVCGTRDTGHQSIAPMTSPRNPKTVRPPL